MSGHVVALCGGVGGAKLAFGLARILSPDDLSAGIVGYPKDGIAGYSPQSATDLMRNIILWRQAQLSR